MIESLQVTIKVTPSGIPVVVAPDGATEEEVEFIRYWNTRKLEWVRSMMWTNTSLDEANYEAGIWIKEEE